MLVFRYIATLCQDTRFVSKCKETHLNESCFDSNKWALIVINSFQASTLRIIIHAILRHRLCIIMN